jgi:recombination associated protein RdgC
VVETLRATLGSFGVQFLETEKSPQASMAAWLMLGDAPTRFVIDEDLELQAIDQSKATVRYSRHILDGKEIRAHLQSGKGVTKLGLTWNDRVSFVLTDKLQIKRVNFLNISKDSADNESQLSTDEQFDIDFALMAGELSQMLADLSEALGGEAVRAVPVAA